MAGMIPMVQLPANGNPRTRIIKAQPQKPPVQHMCGIVTQEPKPRTTTVPNVGSVTRESHMHPDVRAVFKENAQLRADLAIARNRLLAYEMRFGVIQ